MRNRSACIFYLAIASCIVGARSASAVVVAGSYALTSDAGVNTSPPVNDPGFYNVGSVGSGAAIYLGNNWVLSANHVSLGPTSFTFYDQASSQYVTGTYSIVNNSGVRLTNPSGDQAGMPSDLVMYKIDPSSSPFGSPNLPQPLIAPATPSVNDTILAVGRGKDRAATQTYWDNSSPTWQTTTAALAAHTGYIVNGPQSMRWGENLVTQSNVTYNFGTVMNPSYVQAYTTRFDQYMPNPSDPSHSGTALANEFQVTQGDSGGGVFRSVSGVWMLGGMIEGLELVGDQPYPSATTPSAPFTAVFGDLSIIADLSIYRSQILQLNPLLGDANGDGIINVQDIGVIASNWLTTGPSGDVNNDGIVNAMDLAYSASRWTVPGNIGGGTGGGMAGGHAVPEPATGALATIAALALWMAKRTRR